MILTIDLRIEEPMSQKPEKTSPPLGTRLRQGFEWLRQAASEPRKNLDDVQARVRHGFDTAKYCLRHLNEDRAPQMAASLAFRTLFGILPVLVVITIAARNILGDNFNQTIDTLIEELGLNDIKIIPPTLDAGQTQTPIGLGEWVDGFVATASSINLAGLGWIGMAVVTFSALWVMITIENSFNVIYRARSGRSWTKRLLVYWCVLTFGPVMLGVLPWLSGNLSAVIATLPRWQWLAVTIDISISILTFWFFMFVVYLWVPNARVRVRPALIGALVAAILLEIGKRSLGAYMANAFAVSSLYGSLGLIPVFMFWMYLMWMFVLVGLEVAAIVQVLRGRDARVMQTEELENLIDPTSVLSLMTVIADGFERGTTLSSDEAARRTGLPFKFTDMTLERLEKRGFLHRIQQKQAYVLARDPEQITADQLMDVAFELVDDGAIHLQSSLCDALRNAQRARAAGTTLASMIPMEATPGSGS